MSQLSTAQIKNGLVFGFGGLLYFVAMRRSSPRIYYESRRLAANALVGIAVDLARHLQQRQFLGPAVVVCDNPVAILSAVRKQWVMAMRRVQIKRASTLRAEEVARLSQAVTYMASMTFNARAPEADPDCSVYFLQPSELTEPPPACFTLYIASRFGADAVEEFAARLPAGALCVVYGDLFDAAARGWTPKVELEAETISAWQQLHAFVTNHGLQTGHLSVLPAKVAQGCLAKIASFRQQLSLARPLSATTIEEQQHYLNLDHLAANLQYSHANAFKNYMHSNLDRQEAMDYFVLTSSL